MSNQERIKSLYWLRPLLIGICLALGYGFTHRSLVWIGSWKEYSKETFKLDKNLPGKRLRSIETTKYLNPLSEFTPYKSYILKKQQYKNTGLEAKRGAKQELVFEEVKVSIESEMILQYPDKQKLQDSQLIFSNKSFDEIFQALPPS